MSSWEKARLQVEAEKITRGIKHVDAEAIKSYARDLKSLLEEADIAESKAFLRSFVKRIEIDKSQAVVHYNLPMPPDGKRTQSLGVLPIDTPGGAEGTRTPDLLRAKEALSQLSYSPTCENIIATNTLIHNFRLGKQYSKHPPPHRKS